MSDRPGNAAALARVLRYHDGTKHHFDRFARSLGYLDWASQPAPFRAFAGAPVLELPRHRIANPRTPLEAITIDAIADVLRHSLGLSAWKRFRDVRWSLRANPSSGNLHPTEAYIVCGPSTGSDIRASVWHYAPDRHALERRCAFDADAWSPPAAEHAALIALTSIHWREAWKYGERAFRYCQHDLGHAIAAVRLAAALVGWRASIAADWSHQEIASLTGIDRDDDYVDAEREEPACVLIVGPETRAAAPDRERLVGAVRRGAWAGRASQLSEDHVQWTFIDEIAEITRDEGREGRERQEGREGQEGRQGLEGREGRARYDRALILRRRSALALDGRSRCSADTFLRMLSRVMPDAGPPWDAIWWPACVHLALFVHRVDDVAPGMYVLARTESVVERFQAACRRAFPWERCGPLPLYRLEQRDVTSLAARVSCDQAIAGDGFFSLGMIADFDLSLREFGPAFYRQLFWETGIVGQVLYLEAEAAGARGTGIGCFYDDPVHEVLGLTGHAFQSLYHFAVGMPVDDARLTTEPGYEWEK